MKKNNEKLPIKAVEVEKNENSDFQVARFVDGDFELEVSADFNSETFWLTQNDMATLFDVDRTRITRHISNIIKEGELDEKSNVRKTHFAHSDRRIGFLTIEDSSVVQIEGKRTVKRKRT